MIAYTLTDTKDFMNKLLRSEIFDHFLLQEAVITGAATYTINGRITKDFFSEEELDEQGLRDCAFLPYGLLRANCFDLIKGRKTPSALRFVLLLSPSNLAKTVEAAGSSFTPADVSAMYLNFNFRNKTVLLTTGIAYNLFSTDKTLDAAWDQMVKRFLQVNRIEFEEKTE